MAVLGGAVIGILVVAGLVLVSLLLQSAFLRYIARWTTGAEVGWGMALITTIVAAFTQGCASGVLGGADGSLIGLVVGFAAWSATVSVLNQIEFAKAATTGLVMAVVQWVITWMIVLAGLAALVGGLLGLAALT